MSDVVGDDEQLYRRVQEKVGEQLCYRVEHGRIVFLHAAFNDPKKNPSVDRAILRHRRDPHLTRTSANDGIVSLQAAGIRRLGPIQKLDEKGRPTKDVYGVDVAADPKPGNCSHALVMMSPNIAGNGAFKRLKEGLVRLANDTGWTVEPHSELPKRHGHQIRDFLMCLLHRFRRRL
jgi:hypothetical protein